VMSPLLITLVCFVGLQGANGLPKVRTNPGVESNGSFVHANFHVKIGGSTQHFAPEVTERICPRHWHNIAGRCYKHIDERMTWSDAKDYCEHTLDIDGFVTGLAIPDHRSDFEELASEYGQKNPWNKALKPQFVNGKHRRNSGPWIGANDIDEEGEWEWAGKLTQHFDRHDIPNGDFFDDNWGPTHDEDCMEIFNSDGYVNDLDCEFWEMTFICQAWKEDTHRKSLREQKSRYRPMP